MLMFPLYFIGYVNSQLKPMKNLHRQVLIIELDEMWHFIKSKKTSAGYGRLSAVLPASSLTGNAEIVVAKL
jgi:hypothetical protein